MQGIRHSRVSAPMNAAIAVMVGASGTIPAVPSIELEPPCYAPTAAEFAAVDDALGDNSDPLLRKYDGQPDERKAADTRRDQLAKKLGLVMHSYTPAEKKKNNFPHALAQLQTFAGQYGVKISVATVHQRDKDPVPTAADLASSVAVDAVNIVGSYLSKLPEKTVKNLGVKQIEFIATEDNDPTTDIRPAHMVMDGSGMMRTSVDVPDGYTEHETGHAAEECNNNIVIAKFDPQFRATQDGETHYHTNGDLLPGVDLFTATEFRSKVDDIAAAKKVQLGYYAPAANLAARCELASLATQVQVSSGYNDTVIETKADRVRDMLDPVSNNNNYAYDPAFPQIFAGTRLLAARMYHEDPAFMTYLLQTVERPLNCTTDLQAALADAKIAATQPDRNCTVVMDKSTAPGRRLAQSGTDSTTIDCVPAKKVSAFYKPVTPVSAP